MLCKLLRERNEVMHRVMATVMLYIAPVQCKPLTAHVHQPSTLCIPCGVQLLSCAEHPQPLRLRSRLGLRARWVSADCLCWACHGVFCSVIIRHSLTNAYPAAEWLLAVLQDSMRSTACVPSGTVCGVAQQFQYMCSSPALGTTCVSHLCVFPAPCRELADQVEVYLEQAVTTISNMAAAKGPGRYPLHKGTDPWAANPYIRPPARGRLPVDANTALCWTLEDLLRVQGDAVHDVPEDEDAHEDEQDKPAAQPALAATAMLGETLIR